MTKNLSATGRYSRSSNAVEAILSNQLDPGQTGGGPVPASSLNSHTVYSDGEARLDYNSRPVTASAIFKTVSFGVPGDLAPTLTTMSTGGGLVRVERHGARSHAGRRRRRLVRHGALEPGRERARTVKAASRRPSRRRPATPSA